MNLTSSGLYIGETMRFAHSPRSLISVPRHYLSTITSPAIRTINRVSSIAVTTENFSSDVAAADDSNFGFHRPDMYKSNLAGSVNPYDRHIFLCYKTHESWPSRVEDSEADPLPKLLSDALKARKNELGLKTRLTICEGLEGTKLSDGDVLIFPDMIKCRNLKDSEVDGFVEDVLVNGKTWASGVEESMTGSHIFVCAHNSRDRRCGVCGLALIEKFKEEIKSRDLEDKVFVTACSHVGGHKYAGNLIIFGTNKDGKIAGHWFGYVTPDDVPELLDQHIAKGEIIKRLWRGQMGVVVSVEELENEEKPKESVEEGAGGFSCCRDGSSEIAEIEKKRLSS